MSEYPDIRVAILLQLTRSISAHGNINEHPDAKNTFEYQNNKRILNGANIRCNLTTCSNVFWDLNVLI